MARNLNPKCKQCRREGVKLFLKGERCYSPKCPMVKRKYPPGMHGSRLRKRISPYGLQLREKQKMKRIYRILERQFRNYFEKAQRKKGDTGINLLILLETRLDNVIYRANFAESRDAARQMVNHGHFKVNNRKVDIPSYQVKPKDVISLKEKSRLKTKIQGIIKAKEEECPDWLSIDEKNLKIKINDLPKEEDLPKNIDTKLIVEYYSR